MSRSGIDFKAGTLGLLKRGLEETQREHMALGTDAAEALGVRILKDAENHAPVRTGTLRKSGRTYRGRSRNPRTFNEVKMTFGVRRRKRKSGRRSRGRADYASIVHNNPNLRLRRGETQFLYRAVGRNAYLLRGLIAQKWRAR